MLYEERGTCYTELCYMSGPLYKELGVHVI